MNTIDIGLCGYGFIGKMHALAYKTMGITTPGDVSPRMRTLCSSSVLESDDFEVVTSDFADIIDDAQISLVDICTPDFLHYEQAMLALEKRKNLYLEKPIAQTLEQAKIIAQTAHRLGVINQTALVMRFQPKVAAARDIIKNGDLGEIINFKAKIFNNAYLNPNRQVNWRLSGDKAAGGSLMDTGVHVADLVRFLLGEVAEVSCRTSIQFKERFTDDNRTEKIEMTNDEWSFMNLTLVSGVQGELETSRIAAGVTPRNYFEIYGTNGYMYIDLLSNGFLRIYRYDLGKEFTGPIPPASDYARHLAVIHPKPMFDLGTMVDTHSASAMNVLYNINAGCVVMDETPTLWEAYLSQSIVEMGYQSAKDGGRVVERDEIVG
ncbi:MAG: Gfo/Idh/MocA family oxidoreductase [Oscillospiraceae bacterium]